MIYAVVVLVITYKNLLLEKKCFIKTSLTFIHFTITTLHNSLLFYVVPVCIAGGRPLGSLEDAPGILAGWSGPAKVTADSAASSRVIFAERGGIDDGGIAGVCCSLEAGGCGLRLSRAASMLRAG